MSREQVRNHLFHTPNSSEFLSYWRGKTWREGDLGIMNLLCGIEDKTTITLLFVMQSTAANPVQENMNTSSHSLSFIHLFICGFLRQDPRVSHTHNPLSSS